MNNMPIEDQYPSTSDAGALWSNDPLLEILVGGCERVEAGHSTGHYVSQDGFGRFDVCAVGSVIVADGKADEGICVDRQNVERFLEEHLSAAAKEAISLLNAKAIELHPRSASYGTWTGPFEWVNQTAPYAKASILRIYAAVIRDRKAELEARETESRRIVARKEPKTAARRERRKVVAGS